VIQTDGPGHNPLIDAMRKLSPALLLAWALLGISLFNAVGSLRQYYHWPVFASDEWTGLERSLVHAKAALNGLPDRHIEYRIEEASDTYDSSAYYRLQNILAPTILQTEAAPDRYVLVEFWATRRVRPLPDLILVEDFGNGFGLYRRPS